MATHSTLTGGQRLHLAWLADRDGSVSFEAYTDLMAGLARFIAAEGIRPDPFGRDAGPLNDGFTAATMTAHPADFPPGSFGHAVLRAAGLA